ncbi:hypothetical protein BV22DRAFT_802767 [Leucogyrophana mollusca]|uniref:Uncharacterized protein n=1 Tax=Leucogyrophana mollusca TaxID=85980 RepID=A0ACB8B445_9AGAM|nr:hypothetical protein BV22DRAFT_802767 [Leucogyrophana mollusca]
MSWLGGVCLYLALFHRTSHHDIHHAEYHCFLASTCGLTTNLTSGPPPRVHSALHEISFFPIAWITICSAEHHKGYRERVTGFDGRTWRVCFCFRRSVPMASTSLAETNDLSLRSIREARVSTPR